MSEATLYVPRERTLPFLAAAIAVSLGVHGLLLLVLADRSLPRNTAQKPIELVMVEVEPPKPPPPPPPKEEEAPKPKLKPPPIKVAEAKPPPKVDEAPPPPNDAPPPETPPKPVPLITGISLSSTTAAGTFSAPVGNTLYGKTSDKAVAPEEVKPYAAPKYTPVYQVDSQPRLLGEVKIPYPEEAKREGIEGRVILSVTIDLSGQVVNVKVLSGPGYGLDEAAREALKRFRFSPAVKGGEPVSTTINYTYTFTLD